MSPRETKKNESGGGRPRIDNIENCRRNGPSTPNAETIAIRPSWQPKTVDKEGGGKRTWPGARECKREDEADKVAKGEATMS